MTPTRRVERLRYPISMQPLSTKTPSLAVASAVVIGALAAMALVNRNLAKKAERDNPASGSFLHVDGVRLHYVERGSGDPLVLLHGNGSMIEDFESSGPINLAAQDYRHVFDRPDSATVTARATSYGRRTPKPNSLNTPWIGSTFLTPSSSDTHGGRRLRCR